MKLHYRGFMSGNAKATEERVDWRKNGGDCESITDKSSFIPNKELMRKAQAGITMPSQLAYDFPNGEPDNGMKVPVSRIKGADIAEISQAIKKEQKTISGEIQKAEAEAAATAAAQARLNAIKEAARGE